MEFIFYTLSGTVAQYSKGQYLKSQLINIQILQSYYYDEKGNRRKRFSLISRKRNCVMSFYFVVTDILSANNSTELELLQEHFKSFVEGVNTEEIKDTFEWILNIKEEGNLLQDPHFFSIEITNEIINFLQND